MIQKVVDIDQIKVKYKLAQLLDFVLFQHGNQNKGFYNGTRFPNNQGCMWHLKEKLN